MNKLFAYKTLGLVREAIKVRVCQTDPSAKEGCTGNILNIKEGTINLQTTLRTEIFIPVIYDREVVGTTFTWKTFVNF